MQGTEIYFVWSDSGEEEAVRASSYREAVRLSSFGSSIPEAVSQQDHRPSAHEIIHWCESTGEPIFAGEPYNLYEDDIAEFAEDYDGGQFGPVLWTKPAEALDSTA